MTGVRQGRSFIPNCDHAFINKIGSYDLTSRSPVKKQKVGACQAPMAVNPADPVHGYSPSASSRCYISLPPSRSRASRHRSQDRCVGGQLARWTRSRPRSIACRRPEYTHTCTQHVDTPGRRPLPHSHRGVVR